MIKFTKKIQLEGNHTIWAYVCRNNKRIAFKGFNYIFTALCLPWLEKKYLKKAYKKANKRADNIMEVCEKNELSL